MIAFDTVPTSSSISILLQILFHPDKQHMTLHMINGSGWLVVLLWCWKSQSQNRMHHTPYEYGKSRWVCFCFLLLFIAHTKYNCIYATYTKHQVDWGWDDCRRSANFLPYFPQVHCISCPIPISNRTSYDHICLIRPYKSLHGICFATGSPLSVRQSKRYDDIVAFSAFDTILKANGSIQQLLLNSLWTQLAYFLLILYMMCLTL